MGEGGLLEVSLSADCASALTRSAGEISGGRDASDLAREAIKSGRALSKLVVGISWTKGSPSPSIVSAPKLKLKDSVILIQ